MDVNLMSENPWIDESYDSPLTSTALPENLVVEETTIGTLFIIIIVAILVIVLLFSMAIFIDCRQQKLGNKHTHIGSGLRINLPRFPSSVLREDEEYFSDKMYLPNTSNGYF